ncbi:hypothetical protein FRC15_001167 [Serendipita sp. 397]|nr:hypothetical protein FRC15_001167 [Serendipita sp. 397]
MAAVGGAMEESYAERAKKATVSSRFRSQVKQLDPSGGSEATGASSSAISETLGSSPALSVTQTTPTSAAQPHSVTILSESSHQASPERKATALPVRNVWSERQGKAHQKSQPVSHVPDSMINPEKSSSSKNEVPSKSKMQGSKGSVQASSSSSASKPTVNNDDPFVVKYNLAPPSLADTQSWPQVGDALVPPTSVQRVKSSSASASPLSAAISGSHTPIKTPSEHDGDLSPTKKHKGEKTKWVAMPAQELQAAADAQRALVSKSHSPRFNGRGRKQNMDGTDHKKEGGPSPVSTGSTRHDRNSSLNVPSGASSLRVSPLQLSSGLPPTGTNSDQEQSRFPDAAMSNPQPSPSQPTGPLHSSLSHLPPGSTGGIKSSSQHSYQQPDVPNQPHLDSAHPAPPISYPSMWQAAMYAPAFYPSYTQNPVVSQATDTNHASVYRREKRRRRPRPEDAPPLAGYMTAIPSILNHHNVPSHFNFYVDKKTSIPQMDIPLIPRSSPQRPTRGPWWSIGSPESMAARWLTRTSHLLDPRYTGKELGQHTDLVFFAQTPSQDPAVSTPVEAVALHDISTSVARSMKPIPSQLTLPRPGTGPSSHDIGMAMGITMPSSAILPHPPQTGSLLMGVASASAPASHVPSPVSATSRGDWIRDDPFSVPSHQHHTYGQQSPNVNTRGENPFHPRPMYGNESHGRGSMRGRDERYSSRGGRGRGYVGRGRGFRGFSNPRTYNPHGGSSNPPFPYPGPPTVLPPTGAVYFPDPAMHLQPYPYFSAVPPQGYPPFHMSSTINETNSSHMGPPSPTPLTRLPFQMDNIRYKLLGQIEYYFSHENVAKDVYLRERMDKQGWVPLHILQSFPRIQSLRVSDDIVRDTLQWSQFVEIRHGHVRMAHGVWQKYVMPNAIDSVVPEMPDMWYPGPAPVYPGVMGQPSFHPQYPMQQYPYYGPSQSTNPSTMSNGIAEHILRRPEEKIGNGTTVMESGTSAGGSVHSTPDKIDREDLETSEDDVDFVIGDPAPMVRTTNGHTESR